jgi:hypothetical protein
MLFVAQETKKKLQDLHLTAAARLGGIRIDEHFYEISHQRGTYGRLSKPEQLRQKELNAESLAQVQKAREWLIDEGLADQLLGAYRRLNPTKGDLQGILTLPSGEDKLLLPSSASTDDYGSLPGGESSNADDQVMLCSLFTVPRGLTIGLPVLSFVHGDTS